MNSDSQPSNQALTNRDWFVIVFAMVLPSIVTWAYFIWWREAWVGLVGKSIQFALPLVWVLVVQRQRLKWVRPNFSSRFLTQPLPRRGDSS